MRKIEEIAVFAKIITSQRVDFNGKAVRAHFGQSNFSFFQQKRKKEILLILIIFAYFKVQKKKRKKENGYDNRSFFHFSNFEVRFKNTKNTVKG